MTPSLPNKLDALSLVLAVGGLGVSAYLTLVHYRDDLLVCAVGGCHTVQKSPYAELEGIPVAVLGLGMYLVMTALLLLRRVRPAQEENLTLATFGLALAGTVFTLYLTYLELFVIHAVCQWCVLVAVITWLLTIVEGWRAWRILQAPIELDENDELDFSA